MPPRFDKRLRRIALLGVVLHTLFLAAAPFEHHDLICHLKTPQHCTSCVSSQLGSDSQAPKSPGACDLTAAGWALSSHALPDGTLLAVSTTGRSPPHFA
jgi:hypothetical protein